MVGLGQLASRREDERRAPLAASRGRSSKKDVEGATLSTAGHDVLKVPRQSGVCGEGSRREGERCQVLIPTITITACPSHG